MWGAIAGDIIGSTHEFKYPPTKHADFEPLFEARVGVTDDTILTIATAEAILQWDDHSETPGYGDAYLRWGRRYPSSYGERFAEWLNSETPRPYRSLGNGSAMRVSPAGWAFDTLEETLKHARLTALPTHNHREGIKGAQAIAHAIFIARNGGDIETIRQTLETEYRYDLSRTVDEIRPDYYFDETCPRTVPEAVTCFLESDSVESTIRLAISLGGDADTLACIAGSIAHAFYGPLPEGIMVEIRKRTPPDMLDVADRFCERYKIE